jgi:hypothetical protein
VSGYHLSLRLNEAEHILVELKYWITIIYAYLFI